MTEDRMVQLVRARLAEHQPGGVILDLDEKGVRHEDDYWYVPVRPSTEPPRVSEYYEVLAEIEDALRRENQLQIWLVPGAPRRATAEPEANEVSKHWCPPLTRKKLVELVRAELQKHPLDGVSLDVVSEEVRRQDGYWHVGVRPSAKLSRLYDLYEVLAEVEGHLEEIEEIPIRLHSSFPGDPADIDASSNAGRATDRGSDE